MASTLTTATASSVILIGGAQSCNVFWQVGSSATLGGSTSFRGNILALTSITLVTSATVDGRVLARNGAVTLDTNTITRSTCAVTATPTPATSAPATVTPAAPTVTPATPTVTPAAPTVAPTIAPTATAVPIGNVPAAAAPITNLPSTSSDALALPLLLVALILAGVGMFLLRSPTQRS